MSKTQAVPQRSSPHHDEQIRPGDSQPAFSITAVTLSEQGSRCRSSGGDSKDPQLLWRFPPKIVTVKTGKETTRLLIRKLRNKGTASAGPHQSTIITRASAPASAPSLRTFSIATSDPGKKHGCEPCSASRQNTLPPRSSFCRSFLQPRHNGVRHKHLLTRRFIQPAILCARSPTNPFKAFGIRHSCATRSIRPNLAFLALSPWILNPSS